MMAFRFSAGVAFLSLETAVWPFMPGEYLIPSTALIFLKRALPMTKPEILPVLDVRF
jgi:hypothetical protein